MINRAEHIILELINAEGAAVTSEKLAQAVGVSSRTAKAEMPQVDKLLSEHGAHLEARRNRGYRIVVDDEEAFSFYRGNLAVRAVNIVRANYDHTSRVLYIARRLVAATSGVRIEDLCREMALSRSAVRAPLKDAYEFCASYRLEVTSSAGYGLRAQGEEHMVRLAITELHEVLFHTYDAEDTFDEYTRWIGCDRQERQDIRHAFLRVLRRSGISLSDTATQHGAVYLVVARNRLQAGMRLALPAAWIEEVAGTCCHAVAKAVFEELAARFEGYEPNEQEVAFLAIWLLRYLDVDLERPIEDVAPALCDEVRSASRVVLDAVGGQVGLDFEAVPRAVPFFEQAMLPIVAGAHFDLNGIREFTGGINRHQMYGPVFNYLSWIFVTAVERELGCDLSLADANQFAAFCLWLCQQREFDAKPLRVLISSAAGTEFARMQGALVKRKFPRLVASCHACELYEVREYAREDYDALITDLHYAYNYDYPEIGISLERHELDCNALYNQILVDALQVDRYLPPVERIHVEQGVQVSSFSQLAQVVAYQCADEQASAAELLLDFERQHALVVGTDKGRCGFLFRMVDAPERERVECYRLAKPVRWDDDKIQWVLYLQVCLAGDLLRLKAYDLMLSFTRELPDSIASAEDVREFLRATLRGALMSD